MGMRLGTVAIIMAVVTQIDLQHLIHFFQQSEGFVNGCLTHGWKLAFDLCVQLACAGMSFTDCNQSHQLDALGGQPETALFQCGDQFIKTDIWIGHEISFENRF